MSSLVLDTKSPTSSDQGTSSSTVDGIGQSPDVLEDDFEEQQSPRSSGATGSGRTRLSRASKADCLLRMNRRVSMKPQRKGIAAMAPNSTADEDIKKFYMNNKLGSATAHQHALETIFEEPSMVRNELRLIGLKKLKRSINCKDGVTVSKTTVQSRRKKIKTLLGTTSKKFNKLSMDAFLQHLQGMSEEAEGGEGEGQGDSYRSQQVVVIKKSETVVSETGAEAAAASSMAATC